MTTLCDVCVLGAGHNGLTAAVFLARAGLRVHVLERSSVLGGAARTERPFAKAPELGHSTGAYLLGVMPPELIDRLALPLELVRRDPHYFLPTLDRRSLLLGADAQKNDAQLRAFFSDADANAVARLEAELALLREDLAPAWLQEAFSLEETAERFIRPELREVFMRLCREPVENYLHRFGFQSELLLAMYAVTDGFSGLSASFGMEGTGHNFLVHNMCRLKGSGGTWMIAKGGMGAVSEALAQEARKAGATIHTEAEVLSMEQEAGGWRVSGSFGECQAETIVAGCDPYRLADLVGDALPGSFQERLRGVQRQGTTFKLNLALSDLPTFTCLPERVGQHQTTSHLLPDERDGSVLAQVRQAWDEVAAGRLADFPTMEWYFHTDAEPSLQDQHGNHSAALFVQWVPHTLASSSWDQERQRYADHLISVASRFAPDLPDLIVDTLPLAPPDIEERFGISGGHIHHVDNTVAFDQRVPHRWPLPGLYAASAGCHPAGSVIGAAGHNAAVRVLQDLGKSLVGTGLSE